MLTAYDIKLAILILQNPEGNAPYKLLHKQLADSLKVYFERGEFNGSFASAIKCLRLAGYEIKL